MKKTLNTLTSVMGLLLVAGLSFADTQDLWDKELGAIKTAKSVVGTSTTLLNVKYVGSNASAVWSLLNLTLTFQSPSGTNDSTIGNNGIFDLSLSTVDTLGEICDAIDLVAGYECKLDAGKRDDSINLIVNAQSSVDLTGGGADLAMSTSIFQGIGIRPQPGKHVRLKKCSWLSNSASAEFAVFGKLKREVNDGRSRNDTTRAFGTPNATVLMATNFSEVAFSTAVAAGTTPTNIGPLDDGALDFADGEHVVIRNSTGIGTTAQNVVASQFGAVGRLSCSWEER